VVDRISDVSKLMKMFIFFCFFLFFIQTGTFLFAQTQDMSRPSLKVGIINGDFKLDGILDESAWANAETAENLTMLEPVEGGVPTAQTRVMALTSPKELIIGVYCYDDPNGIVSFSKNRDAKLSSEDNIRFVLDPFLDGRSGYIFSVNPAGARYDALVANQGEGENSDWDALWDAVALHQPDGWSVEIRIPIQSLSFKKELTEWGFNIERRIQRFQETNRWASPELDYELMQTSRAGLLVGIPKFDLGVGLSIRPAFVGGAGVLERDLDTEYSYDPSLDINQRIGSNTLASVTINTDFAETEVDNRQSNLTRFSLFFPEKRTFFLEGSDIFDFGLGLRNELKAFHSRRIGLVQGQEVPIRVGGKINGRVGNTNFGALAVHTGEKENLSSASSMGVVRVKQNILAESTIGMIASYGDPLGRGGSWLAGTDFTYQTSRFNGNKNFMFGVWGMAMGRESLDGDKAAFGFKVDYPNDLWDIALTYKRIGESFEPSLGFVPRRNAQLMRAGVTYAPRPKWRLVRQIRNQFFFTLATDLNSKWESYQLFTAPINWRLESGDRIEFNIVPVGECLVENFEISEGVVIPPGSYNWVKYRLESEFAAKRKVSGQVSWWFGGFYEGHLDEFELRLAWKPSETMAFEIIGKQNSADLPFGDFTQRLIGSRVKINFTTNLQLNSLIQYDNESKIWGSNTRLRWIFHPLGDLFLVYNHNVMDIEDRWVKDSNQFLLKFQYAFRY